VVHYTALVETSQSTLSMAIGVRVREQRTRRGWTLDHLASTSTLSRRMLINVEQGTANPSVGTLLKLSEALGIGLPELVEPPTTSGMKVTRSGEGALLWSGEAGGRGVLVASVGPPDVVELWDWSLGAHDDHSSPGHTTGTQELLQVLEGSIEVDVNGERHQLTAGDALNFPGDLPHAYSNPHQIPARFTLTVFEPGRTSTPGKETT
jgi:transcriptional regulator with XRE-family HTH domain